MKLPTTKQRKGYDVLVWMDEDKDIVCQSYTEKGTEFLKTLDKRYAEGDVLEIISHPDEFKAHIPPNLVVGSISPRTNKITKMTAGQLQ